MISKPLTAWLDRFEAYVFQHKQWLPSNLCVSKRCVRNANVIRVIWQFL